VSQQMTRDGCSLKGNIRAARVLCNIYRSGTVTLSWYDKGLPSGARTLVAGPPGSTRAPGEGVSTWDERAVHERHL
jgi:hypothetical protein